MRKRMLSALLALLMVLSLLPAPVMAAAPDQDGLMVAESEWEWDSEEIGEVPDPAPEEDPEETPAAPDPEEDPATPDTASAPGEDLTDSDIPAFVPGVIREEDDELVYPSYETVDDYPIHGATTLPSKYDSRSISQSSVKNQGSNGLCWTFGSYAALEANAIKNGLGELDLSELHMAYSTSDHSGNSLQGWDRAPSEGGNRYKSTAYLMRGTSLSGTVNESDDPYNTSVIGDRALSITKGMPKSYTAQNALFLTGGLKATDEEVKIIKQAIQTYGGVDASIYWDQQTTATNAGEQIYFNKQTSAYYYDVPDNNWSVSDDGTVLSKNANHEIEIVGWDDSYEITNFNADHQPSKPGAWLIKNSWGTSWGDGGYAWVSYEDYNFPLDVMCFDGIKTYDSTATVYETDYKFSGGGWGYGGTTTSAYFAKVYTTETINEQLNSVRFSTTQPISKIEVDYITNFSSWTGYTFKAKGTVTPEWECPGWYTVDLDTPVLLGAAGTKFAVVVKLTAGDGAEGVRIGYDSSNAISAAEAHSNAETYITSSGTSWSNSGENFCIKAVTTPGNVPVTGVTLNKTSLTLGVGGTETLTATVAPANANNKNVSWKSSDTSVATVDDNGKVTGVGKGTATITVTTSDGSFSAACAVEVVELGLNKSTLSLLTGKYETLSVIGADSSMKFTWSSDNTAVAKVASGKVTAVAPGVATISATASTGGSISCKVYVYEFTGLVFTGEGSSGKATDTFSCMQFTDDYHEQTFTLTAQLKAGADLAGIEGLDAPTVSNSNDKAATVGDPELSAEGGTVTISLVVNPVAVGSSTIKVTFGGQTATLTFKVNAKTPNKVTGLTILTDEGAEKTSYTYTAEIDEDRDNYHETKTFTIHAAKTIEGEDFAFEVTGAPVVTPSTDKYAEVDYNESELYTKGILTLTATAKAAGSTTIKVTFGGKTATLTFKVTAVAPNTVKTLTFDNGKTSLSDSAELIVGEDPTYTATLNVTTTKGGGIIADSIKDTLKVTSSKTAVVPNENVSVTYSKDANTVTLTATPKGAGSTSIKVTFGGKTATLTLKVEANKVTGLTFQDSGKATYSYTASVDEDKEEYEQKAFTLDVAKTFDSALADAGEPTYTNSKDTVAEVVKTPTYSEDESGTGTITLTVKALKAGSSTIKVTFGGKTATLTFKVTSVAPNTVKALAFDTGKTSLSVPYAAGAAFEEQTYTLNVTKTRDEDPLVAQSVLDSLEATSSKEAVATAEAKYEDDGTVTLTVTPVGVGSTSIKVKFGGKTATLTLKVTQALQESWFSLEKTEYEYTGSAIKPAIVKKTGTPADVKYSVKYANNKAVGDTATVTLKGSGSYSGEVPLTFKIVPVNLNTADVTVTTPKATTYNGKENPAKVTVKANKKTLKAGTDYEILYNGDATVPTDAGEYTLTINGKGNYTGSYTVTDKYVINPALITKLTVSLSSSFKPTTDGPIDPVNDLKLKVKIGTVPFDLGKDYTVQYQYPGSEEWTAAAPTGSSVKGKYTIKITPTTPTSKNFEPTTKAPEVLYVTKTFTLK